MQRGRFGTAGAFALGQRWPKKQKGIDKRPEESGEKNARGHLNPPTGLSRNNRILKGNHYVIY